MVVEVSHIEVDNGQGNWYYVGHFLGLVDAKPKPAILARSAGPFTSELQARGDGKLSAEKDAMRILTANQWPK